MSGSGDAVPAHLQSFQRKSKHRHHHRKEKDPNRGGPEPSSAMRFLRPHDATSTKDLDEGVQASYYLANIVKFLEKRAEEGRPEVTADEIKAACNVELKGKLTKRVRDHPHVQYENGRYSWRGNLESLITNVDELLDALQKSALKTSDLRGCYKGWEKDLKELQEQQVIGVFSADSHKEKVYFYYDPEMMKFRASDMFREMWKGIQVPTSNTDREEKLRNLGGHPVELVEPLDLEDEEEIGGVKKKKRQSRPKKWLNQQFFDEMEE